MVVFSLTLVRHGETIANRDGVIQGHQDVALSEVGERQARLVGKRLQNDRFTHIFASDLSRAADTARTIAQSSVVCQCPVQLDPLLRERSFGEFEGRTFKELMAAAQKSSKKWADFIPKDAETYQQVRVRAQTFFRELCEKMVVSGCPVDRTYTAPGLTNTPTHDSVSLTNGRLTRASMDDASLSNGRLTQSSVDSDAKFDRDHKTNPAHNSRLMVEEEVVAKRARVQEPPLHRLSLDTARPDSDCDHQCEVDGERPLTSCEVDEGQSLSDRVCEVGETRSAVTMARSNSSSSSGCSSLHDSVECPDGDGDLPIPNPDNEPDMNPSNIDLGHINIHPSSNEGRTPSGLSSTHSDIRLPGSLAWEGLQPWVRDVDPFPGSGSAVDPWFHSCPNVSLSPPTQQRLTSVSSVSSGRNSSFDEGDVVTGVAGEVLVVSHGGLIKELVCHLMDDLGCKVAGAKGHALRVCPNTGVSRFMVSISDTDTRPTVTCLMIHDKDHLKELEHPLANTVPV